MTEVIWNWRLSGWERTKEGKYRHTSGALVERRDTLDHTADLWNWFPVGSTRCEDPKLSRIEAMAAALRRIYAMNLKSTVFDHPWALDIYIAIQANSEDAAIAILRDKGLSELEATDVVSCVHTCELQGTELVDYINEWVQEMLAQKAATPE